MRDYLLEIPIFFVNFYHPSFLFLYIETVKRLCLCGSFHYSAR